MSQNTEPTVIPFKRPQSEDYCAKLTQGCLDRHSFKVSATLDGWIELALHRHDGAGNLTYQITRDDARQIVAALNLRIQDITDNCRFENDTRLYDEGSRP